MSRVGKQLIIIPEGVQFDVKGQRVRISGPLGTLEREVRPEIAITVGEKQVTLKPQSSNSKAPAYWGLERSLIANMIGNLHKSPLAHHIILALRWYPAHLVCLWPV